jgi:hypothetical protein
MSGNSRIRKDQVSFCPPPFSREQFDSVRLSCASNALPRDALRSILPLQNSRTPIRFFKDAFRTGGRRVFMICTLLEITRSILSSLPSASRSHQPAHVHQRPNTRIAARPVHIKDVLIRAEAQQFPLPWPIASESQHELEDRGFQVDALPLPRRVVESGVCEAQHIRVEKATAEWHERVLTHVLEVQQEDAGFDAGEERGQGGHGCDALVELAVVAVVDGRGPQAEDEVAEVQVLAVLVEGGRELQGVFCCEKRGSPDYAQFEEILCC